MVFNSKKELDYFTKNCCRFLGMGSQGECFLGPGGIVYKIYHDFESHDDESDYSLDDLLRFKGLDNDTFIFIDDIIKIGDKVVGYTSKYVAGESLSEIDPLFMNLDKFEKMIIDSRPDIIDITSKNIRLCDVYYNVMVGKNFFVKDFDEFSFNFGNLNYNELLQSNTRCFDYELYFFLVDNLFSDYVRKHKELNELYSSKDEDVLVFLKLFRKSLSEDMGMNVKCLFDACELTNEEFERYPYYVRQLKNY